ncbi:MAG: prepilin-type N-terminal cleavage/methylation domain-containing protein, partial [Agathobacter sp.]|nr:prepilin-type N-terminal cleavage/methylation domain-containing protein [Agathobacter sp.]
MNNKGFSLIELIITVAILTIITSAILGFIVTGTKSYGNVNEEVELQQEAQLSFNQLSDLIIDSTNGIKYYYNDNENKIILTDSDITETVTSKTLAIYNTVKEAGVEKKYIYNIIWKKSENKLYLRKDTIAATGAVTKGTPELMAEYVNDFSPSLAKAQNKKKVVIELSFIKNNKSYVSKKNFALRNKAVVNGTIT